MKPITERILKRVRTKGRGSVFTNKDFTEMGSRTSVAQALHRLAQRGEIRRIGRGLYDYPRRSDLLDKTLSPEMPAVAKVLARSKGVEIQPSGAVAANLLGLSTQVPAKWIFLTDGRAASYPVQNQTIVFKHVTPKMLFRGRPTSQIVLQALRYLGDEGVDHRVIEKLRNRLSEVDKRALVRDAKYTTDWLFDCVRRIVGGPEV